MSAALGPGTRFARRYEIERVLKSGGMGAVYAVIDTVTKRKRALKVMLPSLVSNAGLRERFAREATVAAGVESEHIVETFDAGVDEESGAPFMVMELLRGEDLEAELERRGPLPRDEVVTILGQISRALDKTHAAGIVHRDLKPANLFLTTRDDGTPRVIVLDFGVAKALAEGAAAAGTSGIGTPIYMPPEQLSGGAAIGPRSDLYALAHVTFALLTGAPYWNDELVEVKELYPLLSRIMLGAKEGACARAARRAVTLPKAFDAWFTKGTAKDANDRFGEAREMVAELAAALDVPFTPAARESVDVAAPTEPAGKIAFESAPTAPAIASAPAAAAAAPSTPESTPASAKGRDPIDDAASAIATQHTAVSAPAVVTAPRNRVARTVGLAVAAGAVAIAIVAARLNGAPAETHASRSSAAVASIVVAPVGAAPAPITAAPTTTSTAAPAASTTAEAASSASASASSQPNAAASANKPKGRADARAPVDAKKTSLPVASAAAAASPAPSSPAAAPPHGSTENLGF